MSTNTGILLALGSSLLWTFSPIFFSKAGQKIGPFAVNVYRLVIASILLWIIFGVIHIVKCCGSAIPSLETHLWLFLSAFVGLIAGDYLYLKSLVNIGPRRTTQIQTITPIVSMCAAWTLFNEAIGLKSLLGIVLIVTGLIIVVIAENNLKKSNGAEPGKFSFKGYFICILGIIGHGSGAALTRKAFLVDQTMDFSYAAAIRISSAAIIMLILSFISGKNLQRKDTSIFSRDTFKPLLLGTIAGPVTGMLFYISALKNAPAGIVSALSSLSPIIIIPVAILFYKLKVNMIVFIGTAVAVAGVLLISIYK